MVDVRDLGSVEALPAERLEAEVLAVAGQVAAGTCALSVLVGEFDRRGLFESWECLSTAHWLGWKAGIGLHAAREQVRVGRRLLDLPVVRSAFAEGRLSYSKVRALTRVATPDNEAGLVDLALHATAAQVEQACARLRRYADPLADDTELTDGERSGRERCHVSWHTDPDGHLVGTFRLAPDDGDVVRRALTAAAKEFTDSEPDDERRREPGDRRHARALVAIASAWLADPDTGDGPTAEIVVHVDAAALAALTTGPVPRDTADDVPDAPLVVKG